MKIVFCGGGTAGHIIPNIALAEKLHSHQLYYVGTSGMEKNIVAPLVEKGVFCGFYTISAAKLQRKLTLKNLILPIYLAQSVRQAKRHLKEIFPDVVFSKGGYVGLPVVIAAKLLKIPTIIHESDMTMGLANKISALFSTEVLSSYPCNKKAKTTGVIVREEILHGNKQKGLQTMNFDGRKPVLLVMGGSLGAKSLNESVIAHVKQLNCLYDIFLLCGKGKKSNCEFLHEQEFVSNIADVYAASDLCITRGGSNSLAELALAQLPFLCVPLTKCSRGEQVKNAKWFAQKGCGLYATEEQLQQLPVLIQALQEKKDNIISSQKKMSYLYGTDTVVNEILKFCPQQQ